MACTWVMGSAMSRDAGFCRFSGIVLAAAGLVALRFSGGKTTVSVPRGAHAGQVFLHSCTYSTEDGSYPADCGTLVVPA